MYLFLVGGWFFGRWVDVLMVEWFIASCLPVARGMSERRRFLIDKLIN